MAIDPSKPFDLAYEAMPNHDRQRLDLFVKAMIPSMSRTRIQERIREGRVEVNGCVRPSNWRVLPGDNILIRCRSPQDGDDAAKHYILDILYEDDDVIVVNKPAGMVVHPVGKHRHDTLLNALYWRYHEVLPEGESVNLANRLDQFTSGVILATKHAEAKRILQEDFEARVPRKTYIALCRGMPIEETGEIALPIGPDTGNNDHCRMMIRHDALGKECLTYFEVMERFDQGFSLVRLKPVTGRQHQLRVHMAAIGCPLVGDWRYGGGGRLQVRMTNGSEEKIERYALHAAGLTFVHPRSNCEMKLTAPLAQDMDTVLRALRAGAVETIAGKALS